MAEDGSREWQRVKRVADSGDSGREWREWQRVARVAESDECGRH